MGSAVVVVGSQASELTIFSAAELQIKLQDRSKAFKDSCRRVNRCTQGYCPGKASLGPWLHPADSRLRSAMLPVNYVPLPDYQPVNQRIKMGGASRSSRDEWFSLATQICEGQLTFSTHIHEYAQLKTWFKAIKCLWNCHMRVHAFPNNYIPSLLMSSVRPSSF